MSRDLTDSKLVLAGYLLSTGRSVVLPAADWFMRNKKAWRLQELIRQTARRIKDKSGRCSSRLVGVDEEGLILSGLTKCQGGDPNGHAQKIRVRRTWTDNANAPTEWDQVHVEVTCTCPAFQYWGPERQSVVQNYNLPPLQGDASLPSKNLKLKDGTPYTTVKLCKHLISFGKLILADNLTDLFPGFYAEILEPAAGEEI